MTRSAKLLAAALLVAAMSVLHVSSAGAAKPVADEADFVEAFRRDVFVVVGSTLRNPDDTTDPSAPLFNVSGIGLPQTWGEWQAADATSVVQVKGPHTRGEIALTGLVPNGVYSVFYGTIGPDSENPLCPGVERTLAFTSTDRHQSPDAASFVAGADGTAAFSGRVRADLLDVDQLFFSIVYHADGQTWGALPNHGEFNTQGDNCRSSFGDDAMRQMLILQKW
jgi:hypothetical protein